MNIKGTLPSLVLQILTEGPLHGYGISQHIKETSEGVLDFKEGTLYPALHGLENKGFIESHEHIENGRKRRYYQLTKEGQAKLAKDRQEWTNLSLAVSNIFGGE